MSYNDSIEQRRKRSKLTKEMAIADIASSIDYIAKSVESMSASYSEMLRINKNVVTYLQKVEKHEKGMNQIVADIEHTSTKEK